MNDIYRYGIDLSERLLADIDPVDGNFGVSVPSAAALAAHQLLWARHMVTGAPRFRDGVLQSLRAICRSLLVDQIDGGIHCRSATEDQRATHPNKTLADNAQLLELLTWVWRVERCPVLRHSAEKIAGWVIAQMRVPGFGFATSGSVEGQGEGVRADCNGLMLVALVEAGSVFERRAWLALAREVFEELVARLADGHTLLHEVADGAHGASGLLDDYAMMSRAAMRLFEAFGKQRYIMHAQAWVAVLDAAFWNDSDGGYAMSGADASAPTSCARSIVDDDLPSGNALMLGVLARLHALTGTLRYAERARHLVESFHSDIVRSGISAATAVANAMTATRLVSITVSGDPKLSETRELMRIALNCGLPDRLVLGPGAGREPGERPRARISVGARGLASIDEPSRLRAILAAGGIDGSSLG